MINKKVFISGAYWLGIIADAFAAVLLFFPDISGLIFGVKSFSITQEYLYASRMAGALMLGWTVLLFWAWLDPIKRIGVLLITIVPVVMLLLINNFISYFSGVINTSLFYSATILQIIIIIGYVKKYIVPILSHKNRCGKRPIAGVSIYGYGCFHPITVPFNPNLLLEMGRGITFDSRYTIFHVD